MKDSNIEQLKIELHEAKRSIKRRDMIIATLVLILSLKFIYHIEISGCSCRSVIVSDEYYSNTGFIMPSFQEDSTKTTTQCQLSWYCSLFKGLMVNAQEQTELIMYRDDKDRAEGSIQVVMNDCSCWTWSGKIKPSISENSVINLYYTGLNLAGVRKQLINNKMIKTGNIDTESVVTWLEHSKFGQTWDKWVLNKNIGKSKVIDYFVVMAEKKKEDEIGLLLYRKQISFKNEFCPCEITESHLNNIKSNYDYIMFKEVTQFNSKYKLKLIDVEKDM